MHVHMCIAMHTLLYVAHHVFMYLNLRKKEYARRIGTISNHTMIAINVFDLKGQCIGIKAIQVLIKLHSHYDILHIVQQIFSTSQRLI